MGSGVGSPGVVGVGHVLMGCWCSRCRTCTYGVLV